MRPMMLITLAATVAALAAVSIYLTLPEAQQLDGRLEFAKILLQGGVLGALAMAGKKLLDDWEKERERTAEQIARRQEQLRSQQEYLVKLISALRKRFRVALNRTDEEDRVEYPNVWQLEVLSGPSDDKLQHEDTRDVLAIIRILLVGLGLHELIAPLDELNQIIVDLTNWNRIDGPVDVKTWAGIKAKLNQGNKLVESLFWTVTLGKAEPMTNDSI